MSLEELISSIKTPDDVVQCLEQILSRLSVACIVDAKELSRCLGCRQPFGLWAFHEIVSQFTESEDYVLKIDENGKKRYLLTTDCARLVAIRQPTEVGCAYREWMAKTLVAHRKAIGIPDDQAFEWMMSESQRHQDENTRLKKLFSE